MNQRTWKASLETEKDLIEIAVYTRDTWGISQKNAYLKSIKASFDKLTTCPSLGRIRNEIAKNLLSFPVREHVIFYQYDNEHVYIVRVLHNRRDTWRAFS